MVHHIEKHHFAFYSPTLSANLECGTAATTLSLIDPELWKRVVGVLRLRTRDTFDLFDNTYHVTVKLDEQTFKTKKIVVATVVNIAKHKALTPTITVYQGLLRKESFEQIAYSAAQLGITTLQPITCDKTQRSWHGEKERERLHSIMVAACEQSKQFSVPQVLQPITFDDALNKAAHHDSSALACAFEVSGKKLTFLLEAVTKQQHKDFHIFVGPEGGFSTRELTLFKDHSIESYKLTPTVLRSQEAFLVGVAAIRGTAS